MNGSEFVEPAAGVTVILAMLARELVAYLLRSLRRQEDRYQQEIDRLRLEYREFVALHQQATHEAIEQVHRDIAVLRSLVLNRPYRDG